MGKTILFLLLAVGLLANSETIEKKITVEQNMKRLKSLSEKYNCGNNEMKNEKIESCLIISIMLSLTELYQEEPKAKK